MENHNNNVFSLNANDLGTVLNKNADFSKLKKPKLYIIYTGNVQHMNK